VLAYLFKIPVEAGLCFGVLELSCMQKKLKCSVTCSVYDNLNHYYGCLFA
jgi:hypothetical protein